LQEPGQLPPSWEGGQQRCFRQAFFCGQRQFGEPHTPYALGQYIVQRLRDSGTLPPASAGSAGGIFSRAVPIGLPAGRRRRVLRVVFQQRTSQGRRILNVKYLLAQCGSWRYRPPGSKVEYSLNCSQVCRGGAGGIMCLTLRAGCG
jgi:hypothetical protein